MENINLLVGNSVKLLVSWVNFQDISYDQYDFWSTKYGQYAKRIYYKNKIIGSFFIGPLFFFEIFFPSFRKLFVKKKNFPIADAHLIMSYLNLFDLNEDSAYLIKAKEIGIRLLNNSINGFSGYCWGYPFNWMTNRGLWKIGTPLITTTPYCLEAYVKLYETTKEDEYLDVIKSINTFCVKDINNIIINEYQIASSYSPIDHSKVINASSYRAFAIILGSKYSYDEEAILIANKLINFILANQNSDGSWYYAVENKQDEFIDNFHTCFVLKNLYKSNLVLKRDDVKDAIIKGYDYYKINLLNSESIPIPFAFLSRFNVVKEEMYDFAEGINLGVLLKDITLDSFDRSLQIANKLVNEYQLPQGYFITKKMVFNITIKIPFLRWPQSQLFYSLTNLLKILKEK